MGENIRFYIYGVGLAFGAGDRMAEEAVILSGTTDKYQRRVVWVLAIGLVMLVIHNPSQPFLEYIFIPQVGMAMVVGATLFLLFGNWKNLNKESLGPKAIWIPLAIIAGSGVARLVVQPDLHTLAGALFMASMFGLYIISRQYGERVLALFMPVVVILAGSIIIRAILYSPMKNAGLLGYNYALATEFLLFGLIVSPKKYQWWLSGIVFTALFFSGSEEALFCCVVLAFVLLVRRDWSKKLLLLLGILVMILLVSTSLGITQRLYSRAWSLITTTKVAATNPELTEEERQALFIIGTNNRFGGNWRLSPIRPLGYGLKITEVYMGTQHNTVLLIIEQIGPIAAVAWIALIIGGIIRTRWKYAFIIMALIGVWQPLSWTQFAPYLWVMVGAATGSQIKSDLIFRRGSEEDEIAGIVENHILEVQEVKEGGI